jgi:hypothetical protein
MSADIFNTFFSAIFGAMVGTFATFFFIKKINRRKEFNEASGKFTDCFKKEFAQLKYSRESVESILQSSIFKHSSAYYIFRGYVPHAKLEDFDLAWENYIINVPSPYAKNGETYDDSEDEYRIKIHDSIKQLLEFANID